MPPATSGPMQASISQSLPAGSYTLAIEGGAEGTYDTGGYSKYGSVGPYKISGTIPGLGAGAASITDPTGNAGNRIACGSMAAGS